MTLLLHSQLAAGVRLGPHWLLWVVYATEIGYDYDGDEYWFTFERRTPGWRENGNRKQLRVWFNKFKEEFNGVEPSGLWAEWFSIIAWPITHAILPKYLQLQLAKLLYDLRYQLSGLEALNATDVGNLLAANAWDASSRFRGFLEQEELAGRIVLALLRDKRTGSPEPIYPPTLQRVVSDLEHVQNAREWLKEARDFVADRFKGAARVSTSANGVREAQLPGKFSLGVAPSVRPTLLLHPSGDHTWSVIVEVPSFAGVARLSTDFGEFLRNTRFRITGTVDTWRPASALLSSVQRRILKTWPGTAQRLLHFEQPNAALDHLLGAECRLKPSQVWICRIGPDRIAREVMGQTVRPGREYLILSQGQLPKEYHLLSPCIVDCAGISAGLLSLPQTVTTQDINWLQQLGLRVARTIRIWPAGLSGRGWDGEGHSEWLTTERPCFGIVHDHPVQAFVLCLNDDAETVIETSQVGNPIFVRLPQLPAGRHKLSVKVRRSALSTTPLSSPPVVGIVTLNVREPEPWRPGTTSHSGLAVTLDPFDPTLDMFWEGKVGVAVLGPEGRQVTCSMTLANSSGADLLSEEIGSFPLPVTEEVWQRKFNQFVGDTRREWTYLEATSGRFVIRGEELGEYVVRLERDLKPLRWVCRVGHRTMSIRLVDETGRDDETKCQFLGFSRPTKPIRIAIESALVGSEPVPPGGLFIAQQGEVLDLLVASTPHIGGLQDLIIEPELNGVSHSPIEVARILRLLGFWNEARLGGPLAGMRRDRVMERLLERFYEMICGSRWSKTEAAYRANPRSEYALQQLERSVGGPAEFAAALRRGYKQVEPGSGRSARWFTEAAAHYRICSMPSLCEFALKLASQPHQLSSMAAAELDGYLRQVLGKTQMLRGARLLALLTATSNTRRDAGFFPKWEWQSQKSR